MRRLIATAFVLILPMAVSAQPLPALYDVTGVAADDVLNVRENPRASSDKVGELAHDATGVEVIALSDSGDWGRVNVGEGNGWARMTYLAPTPGFDPSLPAFDQPLRCGGTEPFWSLNFDAAGGVAFSELGETPVPLERGPSLTALNRALDLQGVLASAEGVEVVATLRRQECSDGMSDRVYGYDMGLILTDGDGTRLIQGCCSLVAP